MTAKYLSGGFITRVQGLRISPPSIISPFLLKEQSPSPKGTTSARMGMFSWLPHDLFIPSPIRKPKMSDAIITATTWRITTSFKVDYPCLSLLTRLNHLVVPKPAVPSCLVRVVMVVPDCPIDIPHLDIWVLVNI